MCLHGLGQYHLMVGEHREAGKAFSEAVNIAREVYGEDDIQVQLKTSYLTRYRFTYDGYDIVLVVH